MCKLVMVIDRGNFVAEDLLKRLIRLLKPEIWSYDQFLQNKRKSADKIFYFTPVNDTILIGKVNKAIQERNLSLINPFDLQVADKPKFDEIFAKNGMSYPRSMVARTAAEAMDFIRKHRIAIIKARNDCGGSGHFIVNEKWAYAGKRKYFLSFIDNESKERREIFKENLFLSAPFYIQQFLAPDDKSVWRAYIVGRRVEFFSVRKRDNYENLGDHIINVSKGAKYYFPEGDGEIKKKCEDFAEAINLNIGAIDFIFHKGKPYFLEVNCEGIWILICRKFYETPEFDQRKHDFDRFIAEHISENLNKQKA